METRLLIGGEQVPGDGRAAGRGEPRHRGDRGRAWAALPPSRWTPRRSRARGGAPWGPRSRPWSARTCSTRWRRGCGPHSDELARMMTLEGGKPLVENADEVSWTAAAFDFYAEIGRNFAGRVIPPIESTQLALVLKEPMGVVGAIVPWNYPLLLLAVEARAGAGGGQRRWWPSRRSSRPISTLMLAALRRPPAGGNGVAAGRRRRRRRADRVRRAGGLRRIHRLGGDRQADRREVRRAGGADQPGDGRQGPVRRVRRRRAGR